MRNILIIAALATMLAMPAAAMQDRDYHRDDGSYSNRDQDNRQNRDPNYRDQNRDQGYGNQDSNHRDRNHDANYRRRHNYQARGRDYQDCRRNDGTTGTVAGAVGGGVIGNVLGGGTLGTLAGAGGGALLGRHIEQKRSQAEDRRNGC